MSGREFSGLAFAISPEGEMVRVFDTGTELLFLAPRYMPDGTSLRQRQSEAQKRRWERYRTEKERDSMDADAVIVVPMAVAMSQDIFTKHLRLRHPRVPRYYIMSWSNTEKVIGRHQVDHDRGGLDHIHWWKSQGPVPEELITQFEILNENFPEHVPNGELTEAIALECRRRHKAGNVTKRELAAEFGVLLKDMSHAIWGAGRWSYLNGDKDA